MSTKTTFKRVALVAVAALGVGMLSAVPSNAAPSFGAGTYGTFGSSTITQVVGGQASTVLTLDINVITNVAVTGVGSIVSSLMTTAGTPAGVQTRTTGAANWSDSNSGSVNTDTIVISSSVAGTTTITATPLSANGTPGTAVTQTITWGAAAGLSGQYSTAYIGKVGGTFPIADATVSAPVTTNQFAANIGLTLKDSNNVALTGQSVSVTVSGPGLLGIQAGSAGISTTVPAVTGRAVSLSATTMAAASTATINVYGDGTAGTSTITVTAGALTYTKTITFYGNAATTTATQALYIAKAGTALGSVGAVTAPVGDTVAHTVAVTGKVKDAAGNAVTGATVKVVSSNTSVITAGSCVEETTDAPGTYDCQVSGAVGAASGSTATVTFEVLNTTTSAYDITAAPLTFTIGGAISSMVLSTNATSYAPLAPVTLTVTAKDSAGNFAYDQDVATGLIASLVSSTQLGGTLASPIKLVHGVGSKTGLYAPSLSGDFTISGTDNVSTAGEAVSVTATVAGGDTSAAVDAANAATDAANYAADAADAATTAAQEATAAAQAAQDSADAATAAVVALGLRVNVLMASVRAQLTSLSNLLVRIIKKTKA